MESMGQGQTIGTAAHSPCCPEHPARDCASCALMASCAVHCLDIGLAEAAIAPTIEDSLAAFIPVSAENLTGIEHSPPLRPPLLAYSPTDAPPAPRVG